MNVPDWQRAEQAYEKLPMILRNTSPAFAASDEANALAPEDWGLPGVVLSAWGRFLARVFSQERRGQLVAGELSIVEEQFELLERLCSSEDPEVLNAVAVEVFEHLHEGDEWHRDFARRLGPRARWEYGLATQPEG